LCFHTGTFDRLKCLITPHHHHHHINTGAFNNKQSMGGPEAAAQESQIPDDKVKKVFVFS
jgi:hypothetical protein